jgi:hypothetical protein
MRHALAVAGFCLVLLVPSAALAAVPSAANSTVPQLVGCPAGDLSFTVIVRDAAFNPVPGSTVVLSFPSGASFTHCSGSFPGYVWNPGTRTALAITDSVGRATFAIHQGGLSTSVAVFADGVALRNRAFASTDQNGDLQVNSTDVNIALGKLGTSDGTADFDGNGVVDSLDVGVVQQHSGHNCGGAPGMGANAGPDITVECRGPAGTSVRLDGTASQGTSLTFHWSAPGITFDDPNSATPTGLFPLGTTAVLLEVQSDQGPSQDEVLVTVRDTQGPSLDVSLSPSVLWPPDRRLVPIHAAVTAHDSCDSAPPTVSLFSISVVDGDSSLVQPGDDVQDASLGTADFDFSLRAERTQGALRTYIVCYQARDGSGYATEVCRNVVVARDKGGQAQLLTSPSGSKLILYGSQEHDAATAVGSSLIVRSGNDDLLLATSEAPSLVDVNGDSFMDALFAMVPTPAGSGSIEGLPLWARWSASSGIYLASVQSTPVAVEPEEPTVFGVKITPNPASIRATLVYSVPTQGTVRLRVFDVSGRAVATLVDGTVTAGRHTASFDGVRKTGAHLYFYTLEAGGRRASGKFVLVK